ncbi:metal-dependent transcriptional regulator [Herbiconiux sp. SYSU D00978]|uniref:metal-dependent transcriptional regulator n=1 Tax=Herbiconiux sp. SYSU D00978 TaxID=2812562 RepID=UPI001A9578B1|nr:metal-dependent transcriptional regulator [Herbiconiux sp. SYSU D00978]
MPAGSSVVEDYLKVILAHTEWQPDAITSGQLAARLGLANSSVTEMIKRLVAQGLVDHRPYGAITLTDAGREVALRMTRRHRLLETWLVREFGYGWDEVHDEAEVLEHTVSDRLLDAIDDRLGRPVRDPHGDPIPARDLTVRLPDAVLAAESRAATGTVVRISDRDPEVLRALEERGVALDSVVTVAELSDEERAAIWLVRDDGE